MRPGHAGPPCVFPGAGRYRLARKCSINSPMSGTKEGTEVGDITTNRLRSIIGRVERLEEGRQALADDSKHVFAEAKSAGF